MQELLSQTLADFRYLLPELIVMGGSMILLILDLVIPRRLILLIGFCLILLGASWFSTIDGASVSLFSGYLVLGTMEQLIGLVLCIAMIWVVFFPQADQKPMEFYFLLLAMLAGSLFTLKANHLLIVYLALELTSFSGYLITNFNFQKRSFEAGLKYLLFGGVSSAIMLYGISLIYGFTGSLHISDWHFEGTDPFLTIGVAAFLTGLFFKTSLFPFHIWTPGTYEEAPTAAVVVVSIVPKIASFVLLHRVVFALNLPWVDDLVIYAAIATIAVGTFGAIGQQNVKRLIAYGAIVHSGFVMGCLIPGGESGATSFVCYTVVYAVMNLAIFYLIAVYEQLGVTNVEDFKGLGKDRAGFGAFFIIVLISLIGLPPTAGFSAKFYLFSSIWSDFQVTGQFLSLTFLLVAIFSVAISLFYYLKIPFHYYISKGESALIGKPGFFAGFLATIYSIALLWLFFQPEVLNKISDHINLIAW